MQKHLDWLNTILVSENDLEKYELKLKEISGYLYRPDLLGPDLHQRRTLWFQYLPSSR